MVLQNELADEELEHFEDIVEDSDIQANKAADRPGSSDDSSEDEAGSPAPSSDDESSDKGDDDLLGFGGLSNLQEFQQRVQNANSTLPGGYDPRHREPTYWYFFCLLELHVIVFVEFPV